MQPTPDSSQPTPAAPPSDSLWQKFKSNEPFLKVIDILLFILIFGLIIMFVISVLFQGFSSSLWLIPGAAIGGFIIGQFLTPRNSTGISKASLWRRVLFGLSLLATGVALGVVLAIQSVGIANLETEDIWELVQFLTVLAIISFIVILLLFITHWRTQQPSSLLYGIGSSVRQVGNMVAGAIIGLVAFAAYFITNLTLDPPDE